MDFLFSGFIEVKEEDSEPVYLDASRIIAIEQSDCNENSCRVILDGGYGTLNVPMSAAELRRKISEIRARGQRTLISLLKK